MNRLGLYDLNTGILPCCTCQRNMICPIDLLYFICNRFNMAASRHGDANLQSGA